ncbi:DNA repair protein RadA [bacterium]|nr:DNA repair protein RadA [bacterium]
MAKTKTRYLCKECGSESAAWMGKCPSCGAWDSLTELNRVIGKQGARALDGVKRRGMDPVPLSEVPAESATRGSSGVDELDRVLGGGFVPGSVVLVGGDPGIGKSTLLLQVASALAARGETVLYVSGEESPGQVRLRAERLDALEAKILFLASTDLDELREASLNLKPALVIVDSVQTMADTAQEGAPGGVSQLRHVTARLSALAKDRGFPLVLIGHVTKDGQIAGPRMLEHMVDAVLYFEGEERGAGRILRSVKNRFGSTNEVALFEMTGKGLEALSDPSGFLGGRHLQGEVGSAVTVTWTGTRPLAVEVQALVSSPRYGTPARVVQGVDPKRVSLLVAVLEKSTGMQLGGSDIFVSVAGGLKLDDPATDAALLAALASSFTGKPVPEATVFLGEVGLRGNLRPGSQVADRCREAERLGFKRAVVAAEAGDLPPLARRVDGVVALVDFCASESGKAASP